MRTQAQSSVMLMRTGNHDLGNRACTARETPKRASPHQADTATLCRGPGSLLDCRHPQGQMWWWEAGNRNKLDLTLPEWLSAWLTGDIREVRKKRELMLAEESWNRPENDCHRRADR